MNKTTLMAAIVLGALGTGYADYLFTNRGDWPATWPKELEPLRHQARTLSGPLALNRHFGIPFTKREEFEAAWPHLLQVKSAGAPVILVRGSNFFLGGAKAGVVIHSPPLDQPEVAAKAAVKAPPATESDLWNGLSLTATYLELVVDGEVVDLNRIALPADTLIEDRRFQDAKTK